MIDQSKYKQIREQTDDIIGGRPSVIIATPLLWLFIGLMYFIMLIVAILLIISIFSPFILFEPGGSSKISAEEWEGISVLLMVLRVILLGVFLASGFAAWLGRLVLRRNKYIFALIAHMEDMLDLIKGSAEKIPAGANEKRAD